MFTLSVAALIVAALAIAIPLAVVGHGGSKGLGQQRTSTTANATPNPCSSSGCASVVVTQATSRVIVYYGASCTGPRGRWYLNAVVAGPNSALRPSYTLRWSFDPGSSSASPSGAVEVPPLPDEKVMVTLDNGVLTISGTRTGHGPVTATGTMRVRLAGTPTAPLLTITETGVGGVEAKLGLVSPFNHSGGSTTLPVKIVRGCLTADHCGSDPNSSRSNTRFVRRKWTNAGPSRSVPRAAGAPWRSWSERLFQAGS